MENKKNITKFYSKLVKEGVLKSLICSFIMGFLASIIPAIITIVSNDNGLWISLGVCLAVVLAATPLFYFLMFRPTVKKVAERVDRLGLEERVITMMELEKSESYIAMCQREDAKEKLKTVNTKRLRFAIIPTFIVPLIVLAVAAAGSIVMVTVSATSVEPPKFWERTNWQRSPGPTSKEYEYISVFYMAEEGGYIEGITEQLVPYGEDATTVIPIAAPGYIFVGWSDEMRVVERTDKKVRKEIFVSAYFYEITETDPDDRAPQTNVKPGYEEVNKIIDGSQYYGENFEQYYDAVIEKLLGGDELTPNQRIAIELYFEMLKLRTE